MAKKTTPIRLDLNATGGHSVEENPFVARRQKAINATIRLANCDWKSAQEALALFAGLVSRSARPGALGSYQALQADVENWLLHIIDAAEKRRIPTEVRDEVGGLLLGVKLVRPRLIIDAEGRLRPTYQLSFENVEDCCYYSIALLVTNESPFLKRVGRCPTCGMFFFDKRTKEGGPLRFCCKKHKGRHNWWTSTYPHKKWRVPPLPSGRVTSLATGRNARLKPAGQRA
jgi:hypothetical protein